MGQNRYHTPEVCMQAERRHRKTCTVFVGSLSILSAYRAALDNDVDSRSCGTAWWKTDALS